MRHTVTLPHPAREGVTEGVCTCGDVFHYTWGHHEDARNVAADHINELAKAQAEWVYELSGTIIVMEGVSL